MEAVKCPECGRACANEHGLATHRGRAHAKKRHGTNKTDRTNSAIPQVSHTAVGQAFDGLAGMMTAHAEIVTQCLDGLDRLLGQAKELRKAYIRSADRLRKIGADVSAFAAEPTAGSRQQTAGGE